MKRLTATWKSFGTQYRRYVCNQSVAVAMSGGIDSSAVAMILKDRGIDCIGVFMKSWDSSDEHGQETCSVDQDRLHMKEVCNVLKIPSIEVDFTKEYWNEVFSPLIDAYRSGSQTPNPDVFCNRFVKFHHLQKFINNKLGVQTMATGHYARIKLTTESNDDSSYQQSIPQLLRGVDHTKDQSYFLSLVKGEQLKNVLFPLGEMTKKDVKAAVAKRFQGLSVLSKPESMGICFVGERSMPSFLSNYMDLTPGRFIDIDSGQVVGIHTGKEYFTIGQRARIGSDGVSHKYFVVAKACVDKTMLGDYNLPSRIDKQPIISSSCSIVHSGDLLVARGHKHPALFTDSLSVSLQSINWIAGVPPPELFLSGSIKLSCKSRYNEPLTECTASLTTGTSTVSHISSNHNKSNCESSGQINCISDAYIDGFATSSLLLQFINPIRALTAGQVLVLYDGDVCLGGSVIQYSSSNY